MFEESSEDGAAVVAARIRADLSRAPDALVQCAGGVGGQHSLLLEVRGDMESQGGHAMTRCDKCGQELQVGDYPFCKNGSGHGPWRVSVIDDTLEGGPRFFENMGDAPVWIESKSQWRREVAARNLVHVDRHDRDYYRRLFRQHDERLRDEKARA